MEIQNRPFRKGTFDVAQILNIVLAAKITKYLKVIILYIS